ncbi:hypothetical protein F7R15_11765 [Pseudomonas reinekei]|uniref:Uncharacterized protein n=1 Tax=Pseudomonas reinekei TaxID=395598 RepID=A0A6H9RCB1_PSERE|nr:hypothetical protein F7R15_11765 [Pseudomonas reinekei]
MRCQRSKPSCNAYLARDCSDYLWRGSLLPLGCVADASPDDSIRLTIRVDWIGSAARSSGSKLPRHNDWLVLIPLRKT